MDHPYFCEEFKANTLANLAAKINDFARESDLRIISHSIIKNPADIQLEDVPVYRYEALVTFGPIPSSEKNEHELWGKMKEILDSEEGAKRA